MVSFFRPPVVDVETLALQVGTPHLAEQFGTSSNKIFALFRNTDSTVFFFLRRASWRRAWKFSLAFPVRSRTRYRPNESQGDFPRMAEKNDGKIRITNAHKSRSVDDDVFFLAIFSFFSNTNAKNAETDVATQNRNPNWRTAMTERIFLTENRYSGGLDVTQTGRLGQLKADLFNFGQEKIFLTIPHCKMVATSF